MKLESLKLIDELSDLTQRLKEDAIQFKSLDVSQLNSKPSEESWSSLECLDHLVLYGDYYINELSDRIEASSKPSTSYYKTGLIGDYFAKMMIPKEDMKKMKSPKDKIPRKSNLSVATIDEFIAQQDHLLDILEKAKNTDLGKVRCSISISKMIKLKLGDTLRFVIYHNWRHMDQAIKATK